MEHYLTMEGYQIIIQIPLYVFCFAIGAVIEYFNLQYDQIIYRKYEKLVIEMKKLDSKLSFSTKLIILIFILIFLGSYISINYNFVNLGLTGVLLLVNYQLVAETYKMRKAQTQPNVYVFFEPVDDLNEIVEFSIQNIGSGFAHNVKFIDPPVFQYAEDKFLSKVYLIENGVEFLAPNQKVQVFMMQSFEVFAFNSKDPINIKIEYKDTEGEEFKINYKIDFSIVLDVQRMKSRYTKFESNLLDNAKEINKSLSNISSNVGAIANCSIDCTGIMHLESSKLLFAEKNENKKIEIAKSLVKKALFESYNNWKTSNYDLSSTIPISTLKLQSCYLLNVATSVNNILPEKLINDILSCVNELNRLSSVLMLQETRLELYENVANRMLHMYKNFNKYFEDHIESLSALPLHQDY